MPFSSATLVRRSLRHYWRTQVAVMAGVTIAVAVLAGALLTGASVRASLRRIALQRLGNTDAILTSTTLFREQLSLSLPGSIPMLSFEGLASHPVSRRRASRILVYGIDERFWQFHQLPAPATSGPRSALLSPALASELAPQPGDTLLLRLERPSDIPAESVQGRKEDAAAAVRLRFDAVLPPEHLGEFSLSPTQGAVRAIFVPLRRLQEDLDLPGRANLILFRGAPPSAALLRRAFTLADLGIRLQPVGDSLHLDTLSGVLPPSLVPIATHIARDSGLSVLPVLTYMANAIRAGGRSVPYSLAAALPLDALPLAPATRPFPSHSIVLNDWTARDLNVHPGDTISLDYYVWKDDGRLVTESSTFTLAAITPIAGLAADRRLAPGYPGITDADSISGWDPPFPMDLSLIRPRDEDYWDRYRTTAKVFLPLDDGQRLWSTRWGNLSALRLSGADTDRSAFAGRLRDAIDPAAFGLSLLPIRERTLSASRGSTDFGEYFLYFSFFLIVSALLLAGLFFRLGVEQRARELGLLETTGFPRTRASRHIFGEALILAAAGSLAGLPAGLAYAAFILHGLNTWWSGAAGTHDLSLSVSPAPLLIAFLFGILTGAAVPALTLRRLFRETPRSLLAGGWELPAAASRPSRARPFAVLFFLSALALAAAGARGVIPEAAAFFGSGFCLLAACLAFLRAQLNPAATTLSRGLWPLAFRNLSIRPGRTILVASLIASATFLVVSVESFRHGEVPPSSRQSGAGGYRLIAESVRPIYYNPNDAAGREALNLASLHDVNFASFRLKPGDDASCLNLYAPRNPRVLGVPHHFIAEGRFSWASSLALTPEDRANPWLMLERQSHDPSIIPAAADANSLQYVLHKKLGGVIELPGPAGTPVRLQIVATLSSSLFQSELLISEENFRKAFPSIQGFRFFLIDTPAGSAATTAATLEDTLADSGFDAQETAEKLAAYHRVENTYLATFQSLGALGLLLGTLGLATVLVRNVLERRREFALLAAAGFAPARIRSLVWRESLLMLAAGQLAGLAAAALAVAPVAASRGFSASLLSLAAMMAAIFLTGALACRLAASYVGRLPLNEALRAE
ncbi:MAG: ABC transporter permease [Bryobacterales bacterium]|nr:ABC transporter permease [Bryobacterales bacterium]